MTRLFFVFGSLSGGLAVALGAFGAHVLKERLAEAMLTNFETGARYQMVHVLALLAVAWAASRWPDSALPAAAGWLFVAGTLLFSGSLYVMALTGLRWLGAVTPLGGSPLWLVGCACCWPPGEVSEPATEPCLARSRTFCQSGRNRV